MSQQETEGVHTWIRAPELGPPARIHTLIYIPHKLADISLHTDMHYYFLTHKNTLGVGLYAA